MSRDLIRIKGGAKGFQLIVDSSATPEEAQAALEKKLAEHPEFFPEGTEFQLTVADLSKNVRKGLGSFLQTKGMKMKQESAASRGGENTSSGGGGAFAPDAHKGRAASAPVGQVQQTLTINRTVRNGEEIIHEGSVMICGNVNPGARVVAGGSIDVRGRCRGIVHAGAWGDYNAFVVADSLMPMQIRIANLIARSPDEVEKSDYAEKAFIKDGQIVIEPIER